MLEEHVAGHLRRLADQVAIDRLLLFPLSFGFGFLLVRFQSSIALAEDSLDLW